MISISRVLASAALGFALSAISVSAETVLSPDAFRDALMDQVRADVGESACVSRLEKSGLKAGLTQERCEYHLYTETAYVRYLADPSALSSVLKTETTRLVSIMQQGENEADFRERLVVQLRPKSFLSNNDEPMVAHRFAGDMYAVLMLDSPQTLTAVTVPQLEEQSLGEDEAFALGAENTRLRMGRIVMDDYGQVTRLYSENGLISGQVWLPETCEASDKPAAYFLYDYNGVLQADGNNLVSLSKLISYARNMVGNGTALSGTVVRCSSGQWTQLWPATQASLTIPSPDEG